jgi:hypothetical protein
VAKPTLKQVLDALKRQVLVGKAYLNLAQGLLQADPAVTQGSGTFWGLTIDGSLEHAQMAAARLYDRTEGTVTVRSMLFQAAQSAQIAGTFQRGDSQDVTAAILQSVQRVISLQPVLRSIQRRRNKWLAHLDPATVVDPVALSTKAALTIPDIERVFKVTEEIILTMSSLYEGTIGELRFLGGDDYKSALEWIRKAKCAFIQNYEKEFGEWTGPRPSDCSRNPGDLL